MDAQATKALPYEGGRYTLLGCTVSPGFNVDDYEHGAYDENAEMYPSVRSELNRLTGR